MTKLGILVGEDLWTFFHEIHNDLSAHYDVEVYKRKHYNVPLLHGRLNRWAYRHGLQSIMRRSDICFFEWASELLVHASQLPKQCTIVTRLHSFELYEWAPQVNWDAVDKVILVSSAMREMFVQQYPQQAHKTEVIYNGRSLEEFAPPAHRPFRFHLGMLCNITPIKRIYEVVLAVHGLRQQGHDACLYIAGKPLDLRYDAALHRLVQKLDLQDFVVFEGFVADTPVWLHKIDIFISNSFWEGQQVALLEAMAAGCYCLSHWWAGAEEMLPVENLYITEAELQQKVLDYCKKPDSEKLARQGRLRSIAQEKFDLEKMQSNIRRVLQELA